MVGSHAHIVASVCLLSGAVFWTTRLHGARLLISGIVDRLSPLLKMWPSRYFACIARLLHSHSLRQVS